MFKNFRRAAAALFHRHGPGAIVCVTQGEGFAMVWREGEERTRFEIKPGSIYSPGDLMYHGHLTPVTACCAISRCAAVAPNSARIASARSCTR